MALASIQIDQLMEKEPEVLFHENGEEKKMQELRNAEAKKASEGWRKSGSQLKRVGGPTWRRQVRGTAALPPTKLVYSLGSVRQEPGGEAAELAAKGDTTMGEMPSPEASSGPCRAKLQTEWFFVLFFF